VSDNLVRFVRAENLESHVSDFLVLKSFNSLELKLGSYAPRIHWVGRGTGTPTDRYEVNNRLVCECDG
jgi:hypothetical protein